MAKKDLAKPTSQAALALAANVLALRTRNKWSQATLATKAGTVQSLISFIERYKTGEDRHAAIDTIDGIAKAFGVPSHMLLVPGYAAGLRAVPSKVKLDTELLNLVTAGMSMVKRGSRIDRGELAAAMYEAAESEDAESRKQTILRLVHSANK